MRDDTVAIGGRLGSTLTVLGHVAVDRNEPVYIVWNDEACCPMACKVFDTLRYAEREASLLSRLSHPGIVRCFGLLEERYLLMEFLEGRRLDRLADARPSGRLGVNDAIRASVHIASALVHSHRRSVIHLDVKPSNIVVVNGRPILCDFGIARRIGDERPSRRQGTLDYMAPEECQAHEVGPAADVFGLGATIYELMAGDMPWDPGDDDAYPQITEPPTPLRHHRRDVSPDLADLVMSCLRPDPAGRPALPDLMVGLHRHITAGPGVWPGGFDPFAHAEGAP